MECQLPISLCFHPGTIFCEHAACYHMNPTSGWVCVHVICVLTWAGRRGASLRTFSCLFPQSDPTPRCRDNYAACVCLCVARGWRWRWEWCVRGLWDTTDPGKAWQRKRRQCLIGTAPTHSHRHTNKRTHIHICFCLNIYVWTLRLGFFISLVTLYYFRAQYKLDIILFCSLSDTLPSHIYSFVYLMTKSVQCTVNKIRMYTMICYKTDE